MADEAAHRGHESLVDLAKKHPAETAILGVGAILLLLRARAAAGAGGGPIPVPVRSGVASPAVGGGGGVTASDSGVSALQQQTGSALSAIESQIQSLQAAALQHSAASGQVAPPAFYNPGLGAYAGAGAVAGDLGYWTAQSAQTLPDACNYGRCQGILGCIGHFFTTTGTCGFRAAQTVALGAGSLFSGRFLSGLGAAGGYGQIPGAVSGYPGYSGPLGGYGGYGYTPGIAPQGYGSGGVPVPPLYLPTLSQPAPGPQVVNPYAVSYDPTSQAA